MDLYGEFRGCKHTVMEIEVPDDCVSDVDHQNGIHAAGVASQNHEVSDDCVSDVAHQTSSHAAGVAPMPKARLGKGG